MFLALNQLRRVLEDDRHKARIDDLSVTHVACVLQLLLEDAGRRLVGLRRQVDDEPLRATCQASERLPEHILGARHLPE